jgi:uncharacterized protein YegP (UPF0339 family)
MATATKQARTRTPASRDALVTPESGPIRFLIFEDNAGDYYWTLLDRNGRSLGRSPTYASYQDAENAARVVLAGAGSARLDRGASSSRKATRR